MSRISPSRARRTETLVSALRAGHSDFDDYLTKRLEDLHQDLLHECNKIAVARELCLKKDLEKAAKRIEELHVMNNILIKRAANAGVRIDSEALTESSASVSELCLPVPKPAQAPSTSTQEVTDKEASPLSTKAVDLIVSESAQDTLLNSPTGFPLIIPKPTATQVTASFVNGDSKPTELPVRVLNVDNWVASPEPSVEVFASTNCLQPSTAISEYIPKRAKREGMTRGATHHEHFSLWAEWAEHPSSLLHSVTAEELEMHLSSQESTLEMDWLQQHDKDHHESILASFQNGYRCILSPTSGAAMLWELLGLPVLFYDLVTIPLQVFYRSEGDGSRVLDWIVILYWTIDMCLRLLVIAYIDKKNGSVQYNRVKIMKNYLKFAFWLDLVMVAPDWLSMCFGAPRNVALLRIFRIMRLLRVMRMSKLRQIFRKVQDIVDSEYFSVITSILANLIIISGCCHYVACCWFWLGTLTISGYSNWVVAAEVEDAPWELQYVTSLHWSLAMFTPGASKVQPQNIPEHWAAIFVLIFGMVFFSLFISSLTQERLHLKQLTSKIDRENWILRRYLKQHGVSAHLTLRAIRYVDACVAPLMQRVQRKDVVLLSYLSKPLQLEVQAELYFQTLLIHPFLLRLRKYSLSLISNLFAHAVIEVSLAHSDLLFTVGQVCHEMFFLSHGKLAYLLRGTNETQHVSMNEWCCEPVIWVPWVHKGTARAAGECHLISIDSAKMRTTILEHKERDYVRHCAQAYLKDINAQVDNGTPLTDIINIITVDPDSQYMQAIHDNPLRDSSPMKLF